MTTSTQASPNPRDGFGMNSWLVDEIYSQFLADPASVDPAWHSFFTDYRPGVLAAAEAPPAGGSLATGPPGGSLATGPPGGSLPTGSPGGPAPVDRPAGAGSAVEANHSVAGDVPPEVLRGAAARTVANMQASLAVPTATSVRTVPAKLLEDNRIVINHHLARTRGGKVSFTHLIGFAIVRAAVDHPEMNVAYTETGGRPGVLRQAHVNLGLAIDVSRGPGSRGLVVPCVRAAETLEFPAFVAAYEALVAKARAGTLGADDFVGTTISLTNPGGLGTEHSVPRLMPGQGAIIGVGALEYPAAYAGCAPETLAHLAVGRTTTLTSTYDHRVIQGAQSGEFLRRVHDLLLGADSFYDDIFASLRIPYTPVRWVPDVQVTHEGELDKGARVLQLIRAYRVRGHLMADTDPLVFTQRSHPDLDILTYGLTLWDLERSFPVAGFAGQRVMRLRDILGVLRDSYCRTTGIEYMHISDPEQRRWIQDRFERPAARPDPAEQLHILERLGRAEALETFLQTKYIGQKRFGLEGAESMIPMLDAVLAEAAHAGLDEVVIGMPHRGRLNVLANIVGKSYRAIFEEFEGYQDPDTAHGSGDVKYHLGAQGTFSARDGAAIAVSLASNPSHLEAVDPVLEGIVRAKQDVIDKGPSGFTVLPVLLHGDAAFAGQGVVAETLNMSRLRGYRTGGTVHIVVNNQLGFTTSPDEARSSTYCTDVARMVQAPIFHVNGDDPDACVRAARLAFEFRQTFHIDVVVDLVCYRRRGHSEVDEPSFTQPVMYDLIEAKRSVRKLYTEALLGRGDITVSQAEEALRAYQQHLEEVFRETREALAEPAGATGPADRAGGTEPADRAENPVDQPGAVGATDAPVPSIPPAVTAIDAAIAKRIADAQVSLPPGFTVHPKLAPQLTRRASMFEENAVDWAFAETLACGALLLEGHPVRLAGQDSRRGTFNQRHAVIVDRRTGEEYVPLKHLDPQQAPYYAYDSLLSEFAAMGFEYGYSVARPDALVIWEAQFGDFANGAQSVVDEFISAGRAKWGQDSGLVLLLPHGQEGQGPDHSSGRVERYLQLCAEGNMVVAMPASPANFFHLLRRQVLGPIRRPLVVFTPKSTLRAHAATSRADEFTAGGFRPVLDDPWAGTAGLEQAGSWAAGIRRVLLCSGKVSYDLAQAREKRGVRDVAIVRVEQLYPTPVAALREVLLSYPTSAEIVWVQEEPANQGAASHLNAALAGLLTELRPAGPGRPGAPGALPVISRPASAATAAGSQRVYLAEQERLLEAALHLSE